MPSFSCDYRQYRRRRSCLKRMLAPPGISLRNPEGVEPRVFTGLRHGNGLAHRLHAELQNTDVEWNRHDLPVAPNMDSSATKSHCHPVRQRCHPERSEESLHLAVSASL